MDILYKKFLYIIINVIAAFAINGIVEVSFVGNGIHYVVNSLTFIFITVFLLLNSFIRNKLNFTITISWYYFYLCGILFLNSAATTDPKIKMPNVDADNYFFINLIALTIALLISERVNKKSMNRIAMDFSKKLSKPVLYLLFIYPFLFVISTYLSLGFIPMLLGTSIVDDMYNYNYGFLYSYKFIIIISVIAAFNYFLVTKKKVYLVLMILFLLFSLIDGKRAIMLVSIISCMVLYFLYSTSLKRVNFKGIAIVLALTFSSYSILSVIRSDSTDKQKSTVTGILENFPVGVEYTDYVYSFETFIPGKIKDYDFLKSSIGAFVNGAVLELFGLDKTEMVGTGSAYVWMKLYGIELGIRTGIISELYFDYGYYGILIIFLFGFYFDWVNRRLYKANDLLNYFLLLTLFGFNIMLVVSQATVFFGALTMILYLYLFNKLGLFFEKKNKPKKFRILHNGVIE